MDKNIKFPKNLDLILNRSGLKQARFAELFNVNRGKVGSYLRGTSPPIDFLLKLEDELDYKFSLRELWYEEIDVRKIPKKLKSDRNGVSPAIIIGGVEESQKIYKDKSGDPLDNYLNLKNKVKELEQIIFEIKSKIK